MPFFGKDWRSSGDLWIKTPNGWRKAALLRQKLFENLTQSILLRFFRRRMSDEDVCEVTMPVLDKHPQVFLNKLGTRRVITPELDEALELMDFKNSVHDLQRVQFVIMLTKLLIEKFADSSVQAQKTVICILGELVSHCEKTNMDAPAVRRLILSLEKTLSSSRFLHLAFSAHLASRNDLLLYYRNRLETFSVPNEQPTSSMNLLSLPDDCIIAIAFRLADPYDVVRLGATCKRLNALCSAQHIWRSLCDIYFSPSDICRLVSSQKWQGSSPTNTTFVRTNWRSHCLRVYRPYRLQRYFADQPRLCQNCWCVFWKLSGHHCPLRSKDLSYSGRDVAPGDFLQLLISG